MIATHCPSNTYLLLCRTWVNNLGCDIKSSWFYIYNNDDKESHLVYSHLLIDCVDLSHQKYCIDTFTWKTEACLCRGRQCQLQSLNKLEVILSKQCLQRSS